MAKAKKPAKPSRGTRTLRAAAEKKIPRVKAAARIPAARKAQADLHEFQVHQIELEMQNEELKRAQTALEESRDRYLDLFDFAPVAYFTLTRAGQVVDANLTGAGMLGVPRPKLLRRGLGRFVAPQDLPLWDQHRVNVLASDTRVRCELTFHRENGATFYARLDSLRLDSQAREGAEGRSAPAMRVAMTDVSEHRQLEDTQAFLSQCGWRGEKEDFFHALAPHLARCLQMDYVCIDQLVGEGLAAKTLALYDDGQFQDNVEYTLKDTPCGKVLENSFCCFPSGVDRLFPRDSVLRQIKAESYVGVTLHDFQGKPIGLIAVIGRRPLANPRLAEMILKLVAVRAGGELVRRQAAEELKRSNDDLGQFAHVAGHDLQEPLRLIRGFLALLKEQYSPQLEEKAREYIDFSADAAARMSQLITDLLTYSRLDRGTNPVRPTDANLSLLAALANLRGSIEAAGAEVTHDPLPMIDGDHAQLSQLFQNLIGNSLKFRHPDRPCRIHVSAERQAEGWRFAVGDNGIGIPPNARDRVFQIFERLHTREQYAGTGIGLAICKRIVERHGGRIWVDSADGEGATFRFTLPASPWQV